MTRSVNPNDPANTQSTPREPDPRQMALFGRPDSAEHLKITHPTGARKTSLLSALGEPRIIVSGRFDKYSPMDDLKWRPLDDIISENEAPEGHEDR